MMDKQTSDERLLKIIEGSSSTKPQRIITSESRRLKANFIPFKFNLADLKLKFKGFKINLLLVNKGLIGLAVLLTAILIFTFFKGIFISKNNASLFVSADASSVKKLISSEKPKGLSRKNIFEQDIKRNFFLPPGSKLSVDAAEEVPSLAEKIKDLKLVGIIWSQNPEVMIENSKELRTYTLRKGESLNENLKIKNISRNSATLEVITPSGTSDYELR